VTATERHAELVVYAATAAGVTTAVCAARHGVGVVLLEPGKHVGGMVSGGLGYTDVGDMRVVGGMAREFAVAVAGHYGVKVGDYAGPEPHVAEHIFRRWLDDAGVEVVFDAPLTGVELDGNRIVAVVAGGERHTAGVFVDASYEGDLLAKAGVPYAVGREDRSLYGESLAGRTEIRPGKHQFPHYVSPFGDGTEEVVPFVRDEPMVAVGSGDGAVMSYGYRVCLSSAPDRRPFEPRDGYDPARWQLARNWFRRLAESGVELRADRIVGLVRNLPGGKCDGNSIGPLSLNLLDGTNWAYPDGSPDVREHVRRVHRDYTRDFLWFMSTDPDVPRGVRDGLADWGWPADEFTDTDGIPHQLYVRDARRMRGEYVLTQHDLLPTPRRQYDAVAMGSYHIDVREVQRVWRNVYEHPDPRREVVNEGYQSIGVRPYDIPYRALLPRFDDCANLIVPVCVSASHVAFSSVRMEPQYEMLGHVAGLAAMLALADDREVQRVDLGDLQGRLADEGQTLSL
jgi:hypothetical protein